MTQPLVSIIIPCYNQGEYLPQTLDCILNQTLSDWECIIVDDGSTDNSADIARQYQKSDSRFKVITQPNSGSATARNVGLSLSTGEYVQFLDADDLLDSNKLRLQTDYMQKNGLSVSYTNYQKFYLPPETDNYKFINPQPYTTHIIGKFSFSILIRWGVDLSIPLNCFLYRNTFLQTNHIAFDENIRQREDWDFHIKISKHIRCIPFLSKYIGAFYRSNFSGKTGSYSRITKGNLKFITEEKHYLHWYQLPLWSYRLSIELCFLCLRALKYHELAGFKVLKEIRWKDSILLLTLAILLLPLAIIHVLIRSIYVYL